MLFQCHFEEAKRLRNLAKRSAMAELDFSLTLEMTQNMRLSLALATFNEESNIEACIISCKGLVDEIVVVDGTSTDKTVEIAKSLGAKVVITSNPSMFHINKQKAIDAAAEGWILQLDADERVTEELKEEIKKAIAMSEEELEKYEKNLPDKKLFERHIRARTPRAKTEAVKDPPAGGGEPRRLNEYNAFFIPRLNYFLGKYLRYGGVYPDGAIRLFKKGKAHLPCRDVHEVMEVEGQIGWLQNPLQHIDSPTFSRYLERNSRYIDYMVEDMKKLNTKKNLFNFIDYIFLKPISWFIMTTFRHKGILDGWQGIVFSFFSALRFPRAYWRYLER